MRCWPDNPAADRRHGGRRRFTALPAVFLLLIASMPGCWSTQSSSSSRDANTTGAEASAIPHADATNESAASSEDATAAATTGVETPDDERVPPAADVFNTMPVPDPSPRRLLVFTSQGPLIVDVTARVGAWPAEGYATLIAARMLIDLKADGQESLAWSDVLDDPGVAAGWYGNPIEGDDDESMSASPESRWDTNGDGLADIDELAVFIAPRSDQDGDWLETAAATQQPSVASAPTWQLLDGDGDAVLSADELTTAPAALAACDMDDDGVITAAEIAEALAIARGDEPSETSEMYTSAPDYAQAQPLARSTDWDLLLYAFDEEYLVGGRVAVGEAPLMIALFTQLDSNASGRLLSSELRHLLDVTPHLTLDAHFDMLGDSHRAAPHVAVTSHIVDEQLASLSADEPATSNTGEPLRFEIAGLSTTASAADHRPAADDDALERAFARLDRDGNTYLDEDELAGSAANAQLPFIDADTNEQVSRDEFADWLRHRATVAGLQWTVRIDDGADSLFAALDTSGDRRIAPRELAASTQTLQTLDVDGDGRLRTGDFSDRLTLSVHLGTGDEAMLGTPPPAPSQTSNTLGAPPWFRAMDTNGDGEIGPGEFLGTPDQFDQLDSDADGFIEPAEAPAG